MKSLFSFKLAFLSISLIMGLFSTTFAQWDEGVAAIVKVKTPPKAKALVAQHLKAIANADFDAFKLTYGHPKAWNDTMMLHYKAINSQGYIVTQDLQDFKSKTPLGFNTGIVMEKGFLIIVVNSQKQLKKSERLPHDILGISAELGAGLRKQGVDPNRSMAFLINTRTMRVMDAGTWNRQSQN